MCSIDLLGSFSIMPKVELGRGCDVALHTYAYISSIANIIITINITLHANETHALHCNHCYRVAMPHERRGYCVTSVTTTTDYRSPTHSTTHVCLEGSSHHHYVSREHEDAAVAGIASGRVRMTFRRATQAGRRGGDSYVGSLTLAAPFPHQLDLSVGLARLIA